MASTRLKRPARSTVAKRAGATSTAKRRATATTTKPPGRATGAKKPPAQGTKATKSAARKWTFVPVRDSKKRERLSPLHLEQLALLATFYDGLATTPATIPPGLFSEWVRLSKVLEHGDHRFDLWMIGRDEGCLFWKGDKEPVGIESIQGGFGAYPKRGYVKRGLALDLDRLAWELNYREGPPSPPVVPEPEPKPSKPKAFVWKPKRVRATPEDFG